MISFFYVGQENGAYTKDNEEIPLKDVGKYSLLSLTLFLTGKNTSL